MLIDVHHHFIPTFHAEAHPTRELPAWSAERSLQMMQKQGIDRALLSLPSPAGSLSRACNERAAAIACAHPQRFGALAALPLPDVAGALDELAHALDDLALDGVILWSNVDGVYVGDPELDPVLAELNRRRALVLLHPNEVARDDENVALYPTAEHPIDLARAYARLVLSDGFVRFPNIRWILADSGGPVPFLAQRLARAHYTDGQSLRWGRIAKDLLFRGNGGLELAQTVAYDSVAADDPVVRAALDRLVPPERIRFGSDFPFRARVSA